MLNLLDANFGWIREHLWSYSVKRGDFCELEKGRSCVAWEKPTNVMEKKKKLSQLGKLLSMIYGRIIYDCFPLLKLTRKGTIFI